MTCQYYSQQSLSRLIKLSSYRTFSTTINRSSSGSPPPATSTSAAQPFSTPFTPSPSKIPGIRPKDKPGASKSAPRSSVPAGTPLKGLGYIKGQETPLAREDEEYPSWLWGLVGTGEEAVDTSGSEGDAFAKSKKQRRLAAKVERTRFSESNNATQVAQVPLEEQSIDLPAGMDIEQGSVAFEARQELNAAMRRARRKKMKETNFLKGMS